MACAIRLAAFGLAAITALPASATARAQSGEASFLTGGWTARIVDRFGVQRTCRIELSATGSIFGNRMANTGTCAGGLAMVARWRSERGRVILSDMAGTALARLRQAPGGLAGVSSAGEQLWLARGGNGFGAGGPSFPGPRRPCQIYYGTSERCAPSADLDAPRLMPGENTTVRVVYPANLRTAPDLSAPSLGIIPLNTCLVAEACVPAPGGGEWCRMRYGDRSGYMLKVFERDGRRAILFSNRCGPG